MAYEVLRRLAETRGDFAQAARMGDFESRKPQIARLILQAKQRGDTVLARQLCEELNSLSTLRFDPTNPSGGAGEWDVSSKLNSVFSYDTGSIPPRSIARITTTYCTAVLFICFVAYFYCYSMLCIYLYVLVLAGGGVVLGTAEARVRNHSRLKTTVRS